VGALRAVVNYIIEKLRDAWEKLKELVDFIIEWIKEKVKALLQPVIDPIVNEIKSWTDNFKEALSNFVQATSAGGVTLSEISSAIQGLFQAIFFGSLFKAMILIFVTLRIVELVSLPLTGAITVLSPLIV